VAADALARADLYASCLDNLRTRYLLNVAAERRATPLINAAAQDLQAEVHRLDPTAEDPCLVCRMGEKVKQDTKTRRCDEAGEVPIQSIVTGSALAASIQALLCLLSLSGADRFHRQRAINFVRFEGQPANLQGWRSRPRWEDECPEHLLETSEA
jgi:hypothetical protein